MAGMGAEMQRRQAAEKMSRTLFEIMILSLSNFDGVSLDGNRAV